MSLSTKLLVQGKVVDLKHREITTKAGDKLTFTNVIIIGNDCIADVQLGRDVGVPKVGDFITGLVEVSVYRDDDQHTLVKYAELAKQAA